MKTAEKEASPSQLEVRQAVEVAKRYCRQLFPKSEVTLEEIEVSDNEAFWLVTLGVHDLGAAVVNQALKNLPWATRPATKLKVFKVDAETGRVRSMKIR